MSQQMDVSSIVKKDPQSFYSLDFDFNNSKLPLLGLKFS